MTENHQRNELIKLLNKGLPFEIEVTRKQKKPGLLGYLSKPDILKETRKFLIKEPTLYTLDRIALEALNIDEKGLKNTENIGGYVKKQRYFRTMARIIAIAVAEREDDEPELEEIFFKALKPSDLINLINAADIASNMPDFINSILSVAAVKTERIEKTELPEQKHLTDEEP